MTAVPRRGRGGQAFPARASKAPFVEGRTRSPIPGLVINRRVRHEVEGLKAAK
jgi:hypothetical protein